MSEAPVTRLNAALEGRYQIERQLGEGGMATVYVADDLRHGRKVALKVLKPELTAVLGAERFLAEIKTTAQLQHPHILPLFDSGEADGYLYYVMPYVEGESLREQLDREHQLPVDEAVDIASKVAGALAYSHRRGVIHRDIKPANILVHDGEPVVADFGIALAVSAAGRGRLTETGLSLGTPFYMSPEQASADRELGPQADIYSVGCMLYEMLVGEPPHTGNTAQAVLAKILTERPRGVTELRSTVPPNVGAAVSKALERLPADRFDSAEAFVRALEDAAFTHAVRAHPAAPPVEAALPAKPRLTSAIPWVVAAAAVGLASWGRLTPTREAPGVPVRMTLSGFELMDQQTGGVRLAISPDGRWIVGAGVDGTTDMLFYRRADDPEFRPLPGTEGAMRPTFSPDGEWLAFEVNGTIRRIAISGGPTLQVADPGLMPHWGVDGTIVFVGNGRMLYRVPFSGGEPTLILADSVGGIRPHLLPDGRGVLFEKSGGVYLLDIERQEVTQIVAKGWNPRYVRSGHILFGHLEQSVFALEFDLETYEVRGTPVPVLPSVRVFGGGATQLAVSDAGTLVYAEGARGTLGGTTGLEWRDVDGSRTSLSLTMPEIGHPRVSPDGERVAYVSDGQIWIYVIDTGLNEQLTSEGVNSSPVWAPDGRSVYFTSGREASVGLDPFRQAIDGVSDAELVFTAPGQSHVSSLSPDGSWLILREETPGPDGIYVARLDRDSVAPVPYLRADWDEEEGEVSPNGRWMAYTSTESGTEDVYVRGFPEPTGKWSVSEGGGSDPVWSPDGSSLYYVGPESLVRVEVSTEGVFSLGAREEVFPVPGGLAGPQHRTFDIHPDGRRFLFPTGPSDTDGTAQRGVTVYVVVNWFEELRERMTS